MRVVLLPGLDGTGELFKWFVERTPDGFECSAVEYPPHRPLSYPEYAAFVLEEHAPSEPYFLVAESFSGPVAVLTAAKRPDALVGVVLCNTFVVPPAWTGFRHLLWNWHLRWPVPKSAAGYFLVGFRRVSEFIEPIRQANRGVDSSVLASRMKTVLSVDVRTDLAGLEVPIMYLRGARDRLVRRRSLKQIMSIRSDTQVAEIAGPHLLLQTAPDESWRAIEDFIARTN